MIRCITYTMILCVFFGCKTQRVNTKTNTQTDARTHQKSIATESKTVNFNSSFQAKNLNSKNLNYDFTLKSQDVNKPAKLTEFRNGKPYRTLLAENAEYTEKKSNKTALNQFFNKNIQDNYKAFKQEISNQTTVINQLQQKVEELKINNTKIATNIKYLLWLIGLLSVIWIGERTGIFSRIKQYLNSL